MASNPQLHLMTKLLNIEGVTVKSYQIIENIGITIYLDNNNKKARFFLTYYAKLTIKMLA